jgi:hypothetical protein
MRPKDEPVIAKIDFDWSQVTSEATTRRVELRRQKWQIRRRELELIASKNHLLPRLDAVGRYRWRGFGDDLFNVNEPPLPRFDNAYSDLVSGDFQEWQLGFELWVPIGFRLAHVATRNAELLLARERALLRDQQREVVHEAADAIAEMDRAYAVLQSSYNRLVASQDQLGAVDAAYEAGDAPLDLLLDAQRRRAEAVVDYTQNRARYAVATKNVHFVKGTLLEYDGVYLAEGPWPGEAYHDAAKLEARRGKPHALNYASSNAPVVSIGPHAQHTGEMAVLQEVPGSPIIEEPLQFEPQPTEPPLEVPAAPPGESLPTPMTSSDRRSAEATLSSSLQMSQAAESGIQPAAATSAVDAAAE